MKLISITLPQGEFQVIGVANLAAKTTKFQGLANGLVFCEDENFEKVRAQVMKSVEINKQREKAN